MAQTWVMRIMDKKVFDLVYGVISALTGGNSGARPPIVQKLVLKRSRGVGLHKGVIAIVILRGGNIGGVGVVGHRELGTRPGGRIRHHPHLLLLEITHIFMASIVGCLFLFAEGILICAVPD
jgi:hypothetical protein